MGLQVLQFNSFFFFMQTKISLVHKHLMFQYFVSYSTQGIIMIVYSSFFEYQERDTHTYQYSDVDPAGRLIKAVWKKKSTPRCHDLYTGKERYMQTYRILVIITVAINQPAYGRYSYCNEFPHYVVFDNSQR